MASTDARPVPRKNTAFRLTFAMFNGDADAMPGDLANITTQLSADANTPTATTNSPGEVGLGFYYIDLTSGEMNADCVAVYAESVTTGVKPMLAVLYPQEVDDIKVDVTHFAGSAAT